MNRPAAKAAGTDTATPPAPARPLGPRSWGLTVALTMVLALVGTMGCGSGNVAPAPRAPGDSGRSFAGLVDVGGGSKLYMECHGSGSPTVLLESGYRDSGQIWTIDDSHPPAVLPGVAGFVHVCVYDRPGTILLQPPPPKLGRSSLLRMPRTAEQVVRDLHRLLAVAGVPGPYVLVGHSMGGLFDRLYAQTYPDQVRGMVLVDAFPATMAQRLGAKWEPYKALLNQAPSGFENNPHLELIDVDASIRQVLGGPALQRIPLVVLSQGKPFQLPPDVPAGFSQSDLQTAWTAGQSDLAALEPGAPHVIATKSSHYIQVEQPDLVIRATRDVVDAVRSGRQTAAAVPDTVGP